MSEPSIQIDFVVPQMRIVAAWVYTPHSPKHKAHRIGHLAFEGWFCNQCGRRCRQIERVKELVPPMERMKKGARRAKY